LSHCQLPYRELWQQILFGIAAHCHHVAFPSRLDAGEIHARCAEPFGRRALLYRGERHERDCVYGPGRTAENREAYERVRWAASRGRMLLGDPAKSIYGLIGPNGSGKTTLFNMISGFFPPTEGRVYLKGEDVTGLPSYELARKGIARTFQLVRVFPKMTLLENLMVAAQHQQDDTALSALFRVGGTKGQCELLLDRAMGLLKVFGLDSAANRLAVDVSYAEQKMTEIARALMTEPDLILLDEPASASCRLSSTAS